MTGHCAGTGADKKKKNFKIPQVPSASWFLVCGLERAIARTAFPLGSWSSPFIWGRLEQERRRPSAGPADRAGDRKRTQTESRGSLSYVLSYFSY